MRGFASHVRFQHLRVVLVMRGYSGEQAEWQELCDIARIGDLLKRMFRLGSLIA